MILGEVVILQVVKCY